MRRQPRLTARPRNPQRGMPKRNDGMTTREQVR